jgi:hypothetical protein
MGQVYCALDTRLGRNVAIKISAARFSESFEQEARVIASLNHPNICALYDVGPNYLVMEFVEGTPLSCPLPLKQSIAYAGQILDALDVAHRKGIAHCDLKPANILVTKLGIKLLDFGLARRHGPLQEMAARPANPLGRAPLAGTLQYMSPEQLQGKDADARSDLFSFGCVLYEMLSGRRPFEGESEGGVIASIMEREPAPLNLAPAVERVIMACLAKDPEHRFQTALDLKRNLTWAQEQPVAPRSRRRGWTAAAAATLVLGAFAGWAVSHFRQQPTDNMVIRFQIAPPEGWGISGGGNLGGAFAISPDGQTAAFVAVAKGKTALWVRPLDAANTRLIRGSDGAARPFWSPDSGSIAFYAGGVLKRVDLSTETISKICAVDTLSWGGSWLPDGRILFATRSGGIFQVRSSGGTPSQLIIPDRSGNEWYPQGLPGGRFLYTVTSADSPNGDVYAASLIRPAERVRLSGLQPEFLHFQHQANPAQHISREFRNATAQMLKTALSRPAVAPCPAILKPQKTPTASDGCPRNTTHICTRRDLETCPSSFREWSATGSTSCSRNCRSAPKRHGRRESTRLLSSWDVSSSHGKSRKGYSRRRGRFRLRSCDGGPRSPGGASS